MGCPPIRMSIRRHSELRTYFSVSFQLKGGLKYEQLAEQLETTVPFKGKPLKADKIFQRNIVAILEYLVLRIWFHPDSAASINPSGRFSFNFSFAIWFIEVHRNGLCPECQHLLTFRLYGPYLSDFALFVFPISGQFSALVMAGAFALQLQSCCCHTESLVSGSFYRGRQHWELRRPFSSHNDSMGSQNLAAKKEAVNFKMVEFFSKDLS